MQVVILCGGFGTRLGREAEVRPKPMVEIGGKPILWHIMKMYSHYGFTDFILCLGYKADVIRQYFLNYHLLSNDVTIHLGSGEMDIHRRDGEPPWTVTLADTGLNTMTGARVKRIQPYVGNHPFMLTYGDGVADLDIPQLLAYHRKHGKVGTVTGVVPTSRYGELVLEGDEVKSFREKPAPVASYISGGYFVLNPEFFDYLEEDDACVLERKPLQSLATEGQLMVYSHRGFWQCMDTPRDHQYLNEVWAQGPAPWKIWE